MRKTSMAVISALALLSACGDTGTDNASETPEAKYPFTPPPLDENPPMSSSRIDQINDEVAQGQKK